MEKSPKTKELEMIAQIAKLKRKLKEMQEYKRLIAEDGIKPDQEDKRRESELIVRLVYLEKQLKGPDNRWGKPISKEVISAPFKGRRVDFQRRRAP
jgi:hypothetical protein